MLSIIRGYDDVPAEAIELQLIELFGCTPSELDKENGWRCLMYLDLKHWRDTALAYKDRDRRKQLPRDDRIRIAKLLKGEKGALRQEIGQGDKMRQFLTDVKKEAKESG